MCENTANSAHAEMHRFAKPRNVDYLELPRVFERKLEKRSSSCISSLSVWTLIDASNCTSPENILNSELFERVEVCFTWEVARAIKDRRNLNSIKEKVLLTSVDFERGHAVATGYGGGRGAADDRINFKVVWEVPIEATDVMYKPCLILDVVDFSNHFSRYAFDDLEEFAISKIVELLKAADIQHDSLEKPLPESITFKTASNGAYLNIHTNKVVAHVPTVITTLIAVRNETVEDSNNAHSKIVEDRNGARSQLVTDFSIFYTHPDGLAFRSAATPFEGSQFESFLTSGKVEGGKVATIFSNVRNLAAMSALNSFRTRTTPSNDTTEIVNACSIAYKAASEEIISNFNI